MCLDAGLRRYGPYSRFRAYGANMEAVVGHTLLRGYTDTDPTTSTPASSSPTPAAAPPAPSRLMAALYHRSKTGEASSSTCRRRRTCSHTLSQAVMDYSMNGRVQATLGNRDP